MDLLGRVIDASRLEVLTEREPHPKEKYIAVDSYGFVQNSPDTSGYDLAERVFKVANYVWDAGSLQWVRSTGSGGGGGSSAPAIKSKLFDQPAADTIYVGEADPGAAPSAPAWRIKRITFNSSGFPTQAKYASVGSASCIWNDRASLTYS